MADPKLKCQKWRRRNDTYRCTQIKGNRCGCWSSVTYPEVKKILHETQMEVRQKLIDEIKGNIQRDQAALVLGAGISAPCKMPLWTPLISKMMGYAIQYDFVGKQHVWGRTEEEQKALVALTQKLIDGRLSLLGKVNTLESAEYVAQFFDDESVDEWVRDQLREDSISTMVHRMINGTMTPQELLCDEKTKLPSVKRNIAKGMSLANAVKCVGLAKVAARNTMFAVSYLLSAPNGIQRAMTYNYDPLVQEYMMDLYGMDPSRIITHPGKWGERGPGKSDDLREIYHVHGFVAGQRHLDKCCERVFPQRSGPLILSEDSYYRIEREEAYNWSSSIQSFFLNRYNCVFVGFSAEDYNFRRILRQMRIEKLKGEDSGCDFGGKPKQYLIMTIDNWIRNTYEDVCHACLDKRCTVEKAEIDQIATDTALLLQHILDCRASYWERFNIYPIWVTEGEIPELLADLLTP